MSDHLLTDALADVFDEMPQIVCSILRAVADYVKCIRIWYVTRNILYVYNCDALTADQAA